LYTGIVLCKNIFSITSVYCFFYFVKSHLSTEKAIFCEQTKAKTKEKQEKVAKCQKMCYNQSIKTKEKIIMLFEKAILKVYKSQLHARCDDTGLLFYYSHEDFSGLSCAPYPFRSSLGHRLSGYFYAYENPIPHRLVVFDHGWGGGHRSYMKEIEKLCRAGFRVFAYDHTGCMTSEGEGARGFSQSLRDLDDCLQTLKADPAVCTDDISVMGHSWGGYATLNIASRHPDVKRVVVLSGFVSVKKMVEQNFAGLLKGYQKAVMALERETNPDYVDADGVATLSATDTKALLIYDEGDPLVKKSPHYIALQEGLKGKENVTLLLTEGKAHNPNYTKEAVVQLAALQKALKKTKNLKTPAQKTAFRDSFDWEKITEQDETLWAEILRFLK